MACRHFAKVLRAFSARRHQRGAMRKRHTFEIVIEKMPQRPVHFLCVHTILRRQEGKSVGFEIDERVSDDQCASILFVINGHFARGPHLDRDSTSIGRECLGILTARAEVNSQAAYVTPGARIGASNFIEVDGGPTVICAVTKMPTTLKCAAHCCKNSAEEGLDRRSKCYRRFRPPGNKDRI